MGTRRTCRWRISSGVLAGALLLGPLAACGDTPESQDTGAAPDVTATESPPAGETGGADEGADATEPQDTADATGPTGETQGTDAGVDCSGNSCAVTLTGGGAQADVLGTSVVLGGVENGRATFRVGDQEFTCGQGESVSAGPLTLACSTVTEDTVTMTASLG